MKEDSVSVGVSEVDTLFIMFANVFIIIAFGVSFLAFAFSFIQFITSTGDKKMTEKAQKNMSWSVIGLFACFILYGIKDALIKAFGINLE
jgi:hypothetical protein